MQLKEFTIFEGQADDTNVFRNVKILGLTSKNGYSYDAKAVAKAVPLYENAPVYVDHAKGNRSYADRIGYIQNPRLQEADIHGDFILNPKHKLAEQVLWDAQHGTSGVGFSHSIDGALNKKTNIVESIDKVFSVDLVAGPACTKSIFESQIKEEDDIDELRKLVNELALAVAEIKASLAEVKPASESLKATQASINEKLDKLTKTKPQYIVPSAAEPVKVQDTYADFIKKIKR